MMKGTENERKEIEKAELKLENEKGPYENEGFVCETSLLIRSLCTGEDLVKFAKEEKVDEIFIGVKRRSKVGKLVFGSTAQYVILKADSPVMTVK